MSKSELIGFRVNTPEGNLPAKCKIGPFYLAAMQSVNPFGTQWVYGLTDTRNVDYSSELPQAISCTFHGAYLSRFYPIMSLKYFLPQQRQEIVAKVDDPYFALLMKTITQISGFDVVVLNFEDGHYSYNREFAFAEVE